MGGSRYILTPRVYSTLEGRGYKLICRRKTCELPLDKLTPKSRNETEADYERRKENCTIESKPSKYHHWECDKCGKKMDEKPTQHIRVIEQAREHWFYVCSCGGIIYDIGRKFYHAKCYDDMHYGSMIVMSYKMRFSWLRRIWKRLIGEK